MVKTTICLFTVGYMPDYFFAQQQQQQATSKGLVSFRGAGWTVLKAKLSEPDAGSSLVFNGEI